MDQVVGLGFFRRDLAAFEKWVLSNLIFPFFSKPVVVSQGGLANTLIVINDVLDTDKLALPVTHI